MLSWRVFGTISSEFRIILCDHGLTWNSRLCNHMKYQKLWQVGYLQVWPRSLARVYRLWNNSNLEAGAGPEPAASRFQFWHPTLPCCLLPYFMWSFVISIRFSDTSVQFQLASILDSIIVGYGFVASVNNAGRRTVVRRPLMYYPFQTH